MYEVEHVVRVENEVGESPRWDIEEQALYIIDNYADVFLDNLGLGLNRRRILSIMYEARKKLMRGWRFPELVKVLTFLQETFHQDQEVEIGIFEFLRPLAREQAESTAALKASRVPRPTARSSPFSILLSGSRGLPARRSAARVRAFFKGARGEERVAAVLAGLPRGFVVFHGVDGGPLHQGDHVGGREHLHPAAAPLDGGVLLSDEERPFGRQARAQLCRQ